MGTVNDLASRDFELVISDHGETAEYVPHDGRAFTFSFVRGDTSDYRSVSELPGVSGPGVRIRALNSQVHGLLSRDINKGKDRIRVSHRYGSEPVQRSIASILYTDYGIVEIECR